MRRHESPGGWYCDVTVDGDTVSQPSAGGPVEFHPLTLPASPGGRLLQLRISRDGTRCCGVGENDGIAWEWAAGAWMNRGPIFGNNAVIYDATDGLVVVSLNQAPTWALGWWYVDDAGQLVPTWLCYDPMTELADTLGIDGLWQWTQRGDCVAGQGLASGAGYAGVDMLVDGRRVRLAEGQCTFVRFYRDGDALALSWIRERPDHASCFLWLTRQEAGDLPTYVPDPTDPTDPVDPEPPTMTYDTGPLNAYAQSRWVQLPHGTREEQATALFTILWEFAVAGHPEVEVYRKGTGGTHYLGSDGHGYAEDICVIVESSGKWWKDVGVAFGSDAARLDFSTAGWQLTAEPEKCFSPPPPAGVVEPPPPPDLTDRVDALETQVQGLTAAVTELERDMKKAFDDIQALQDAAQTGGLTEVQVRALIRDYLARASVRGSTASRYGHAHGVDLGITLQE